LGLGEILVIYYQLGRIHTNISLKPAFLPVLALPTPAVDLALWPPFHGMAFPAPLLIPMG
jgi:hypothetical protein